MKSKKLTDIELEQALNDAWLDLKVDELKLFNPLLNIPQELEDEPYLYITWLFQQPEYFSFFCKEILNVQLLPIQALILKEMWNRKFPMLVAARGFGKAVDPDMPVRIKGGWTIIKRLKVGDRVYGSNGRLCNVTGVTNVQKDLVFYRVTLRDGRQVECCEDHLWKVWKKDVNRNGKNKYITLSTREMYKNYFRVRKNSKSKEYKLTKEYQYALPISQPLMDEKEQCQPLHPYVVGVLLGDGCLTQKTITISSEDQEIIDRVNRFLPEGYVARKIKSSTNDFSIVRTNKNISPFWKICEQACIQGLNSHNKFIPHVYKYGNYTQRLELIRGLMDTDGYSNNSVIEYYTVSNQLSDDFLDVIRSLGLHCKHSIKQSWFNGNRYADCNRIRIYTKLDIFTLSRKLGYINYEISKQVQSKYEKVFITDIEYIGKKDGCCITVDSSDNTYIIKDYIVTHNSFLLGLYALLRLTFIPGRKIVICGSSFRQSKIISNYMESIWNNAPLFRDMVGGERNGPHHEPDMYRFEIGESVSVALPVGCLSGDTLITTDRGIRCIGDFTEETYPKQVWSNGCERSTGFFLENSTGPVKTITTKRGYTYTGTYNHKMKIVRDNQIIWCRTDQMKIGDSILIDRLPKWFTPSFKCTEDQAYTLGCMIGDGGWTNQYYLQLINKDEEIIDNVSSVLGKLTTYDGLHYQINDKKLREDWLNFWDLEVCYTPDKCLPNTILSADKECVASCISGLFDTDGSIQVGENKGGISCKISFYNTSEKLIRQIQYLLLHFGIVCTVTSRQRNNPRTGNICLKCYELYIYGRDIQKFYNEIGFRLSRKQKLLKYYIDNKKRVCDINSHLVPIDKDVLCNIARKYDLTYKFSAGKIRQKKKITQSFLNEFLNHYYNKMNNDEIEFLQTLNQPYIYYDEIVKIEDVDDVNTYDLNVPQNNEYLANGFFSHNSGEKIRGQRANDLLIDEFACIRKDTLIQTSNGLIRVYDYLNGDVNCLLNMDGEFEVPDKIFVTPLTDVYKITVQNGYSFCCSAIHKVMTVDGWKLAKDLTKDDFLELDCNDYFPNKYVFDGDLVLNENIGWLMGLLVAEGTNTNRNNIQITTTDGNLIDIIKQKLPYDWKVYTKEKYKDGRGWNCKKSYNIQLHDTKKRTSLYNFGLKYVTSHAKNIPDKILQSPKSVVVEFLKGLCLGDGSLFQYKSKGKNRVGVSYYSVSEELVSTLQILLLKFGITSSKISRKSKISNNLQWILSCRGLQAVKLIELLGDQNWINIAQNSDKDYLDNIRPCFRTKSVEKLDKQEVLYDFHLPKTHSFIGNGFIQHNSLSREIFETVMSGFLSVKSSPAEEVQQRAQRDLANQLNTSLSDLDDSLQKDNQLIISGTAYYDFNHFAEYWKRWKKIIHSRGNQDKLIQAFNKEELEHDLNWKDYSIIRIPYKLIPKGFLDEAMIARAKATIHSGTFEMEYGAVFSRDSYGFFKRSLIESCVVSSRNRIKFKSGVVDFNPSLTGNSKLRYVYGVDPASEIDNFAVTVLEIHPDHRRIVYVWTTNAANHREKLKAGLISDTDFYGYCARKIRELMLVFPCNRIVMDSQGGGKAVSEALRDKDKLREGEHQIWPIIDYEKPADTDVEPGLHLLELANFASAEWTSDANHGLRKDFEDKVCLFPRFDPAMIELASIKDRNEKRVYDTLEDCIMEIEELKNELSTIIIERTPSGRDRWTTPEIKLPGNRKGYLRKDRYSALVMANAGARVLARTTLPEYHLSQGGFVTGVKGQGKGLEYSGPEWFTSKMRGVYD